MKDLEEIKVSCFGRSIGEKLSRVIIDLPVSGLLTFVQIQSKNCSQMPKLFTTMTLVKRQPYIAPESRSSEEITTCGSKWHDAP